MKRVGKSAAAAFLLALVWCIGWTMPAYASGNPSVVLESAGTDLANRTLWVDCNLERMDTVTNGKVRITYDGSKLKLLENQMGDALSDGMSETNDCLTGNKKEGEIVFAFASSGALPTKGCLANLKFSVTDQVADGEEVSLKVAVEKLAGEKGDVNADKKDLTVKIQKSNPGNTGGSQGGTGIDNGESSGQGGNRGPSSVQGSRNSIGSGRSSAGSAGQSGRNGESGTSRSSIGSSRIGEDGEPKDHQSSDVSDADEISETDPQLETVSDGEVPLAAVGSGVSYWWIIPLIVLAAVIVFLVWRKRQKGTEHIGTGE